MPTAWIARAPRLRFGDGIFGVGVGRPCKAPKTWIENVQNLEKETYCFRLVKHYLSLSNIVFIYNYIHIKGYIYMFIYTVYIYMHIQAWDACDLKCTYLLSFITHTSIITYNFIFRLIKLAKSLFHVIPLSYKYVTVCRCIWTQYINPVLVVYTPHTAQSVPSIGFNWMKLEDSNRQQNIK